MLLRVAYNLGMALGKAICRLRLAKGLTQEALARRAKVSRAYVTLLEGGYRVSPSVKVRKRLARALAVPITKLLE